MYKVRGFTLIELMITIVVVGIIVSLAAPSFRDLVERKHLEGAVEAVLEQLEFTRSQAIKRSKSMLVDFKVNGVDWSIGVTDKMDGCEAEEDDLSDEDACTVDYDNDEATSDNVLVRITGGDYKNITMSQATAFTTPVTLNECTTTTGDQGCFDYVQGLAREGEYEFTSSNNTYTLRVRVSRLGHPSICFPKGKKSVAGYEECPSEET